jgi:hypothetical protein
MPTRAVTRECLSRWKCVCGAPVETGSTGWTFKIWYPKKGRAYVRTSSGWRDRVWVLARGEQAQDFIVHANPPLGSSGFVLEIGNPYAQGDEPERFIVDLGR